jgi:hypothetical protein
MNVKIYVQMRVKHALVANLCATLFTRLHYRKQYGIDDFPKKRGIDDSPKKHCDKCCKVYDYDDFHCEKCHTSYKESSNHCVTCCQTYSISLKHCDKCHKSFTDKEVHCDKCCVIYNPQTTYHCGNCHSYNVNFQSCVICKNNSQTKLCTICMENVNDNMYITKCGHTYHTQCISEWTKKNQSCPLCRSIVSVASIAPNAKYQIEIKKEDINPCHK